MHHRPKCQTQTTKLPKDNIKENLSGFGFGNDFLDIILKAQAMKELLSWTASALPKALVGNEKVSHRLGENICKTQH